MNKGALVKGISADGSNRASQNEREKLLVLPHDVASSLIKSHSPTSGSHAASLIILSGTNVRLICKAFSALIRPKRSAQDPARSI
jgi:hypothetical protein